VQDLSALDRFLEYDSIEDAISYFWTHFQPRELGVVYGTVVDPWAVSSSPHTASCDTVCKPIFRSRITQIDNKLCFVLMPFGEKWSDPVYKQIREVIDNLGLQCLRADNLTGQIIVEDIWAKINQCAFIIADVTTRNPNVMYELGIVHTVGSRPS
jgi:hypothetical protein